MLIPNCKCGGTAGCKLCAKFEGYMIGIGRNPSDVPVCIKCNEEMSELEHNGFYSDESDYYECKKCEFRVSILKATR